MPSFVIRSIALSLAVALGSPLPALAQGAYVDSTAVVSSAAFSQEELDSLLAPIALYPDQLLAQVLMAATYPLDVVEAARFTRQNPGLRGAALDNVLAAKSWDPSVLSLAAFPQVLDMMSARLDWTRRLGEAFLADQDQVMATVQSLRERAQAAGNLYSTPQQTVLSEAGTVIIEPAVPDIVYVPTYNPTIVYGDWWAPAYPPYYWLPPRAYYPGVVVGTGVLGFGIAYTVGHNHWGWARPDWRERHIAIDFDRHNRFIDRRPQYRQWVSDGRWEHRPAPPRGQPNRDGGRWNGYRGTPVQMAPNVAPNLAPNRERSRGPEYRIPERGGIPLRPAPGRVVEAPVRRDLPAARPFVRSDTPRFAPIVPQRAAPRREPAPVAGMIAPRPRQEVAPPRQGAPAAAAPQPRQEAAPREGAQRGGGERGGGHGGGGGGGLGSGG